MPVKKAEFVGGSGFKMPKFRFPGRIAAFGTLGMMILICTVIFFMLFFTYVRPNELGIKQVNVALLGETGIRPEHIEPGFRFRVPGAEAIHRFPRNIQILDMTATPTRDLVGRYKSDRAARIQTSDGFFVDVDVSVAYRIEDPYTLIQEYSLGNGYLLNGIIPKAEPVLKETLGKLTTEEFYNSPLRVEKAHEARDLLNKELNDKGIVVEHVLVRQFEYTHEIQKNIEEKKLQDQLVYKNQSQGRAAKEEAERKRVIEEGEARVRITLEEGEAYKIRKEAERDRYVRTKRAEADLLIELAEATRTELYNEAMQSMGADRKVALEMAEVLRGLEVIIIPAGGEDGLNPLDLRQMTDFFGVERKEGARPGAVAIGGVQ